MIFLVDNYDSFTYNLVQAVGKHDPDVVVARNDRFEPEEVVRRRPRAVLISPGPGRPEQAGRSLAMIAAAESAGIPLLGVCLGHQALAAFHGATVARAPAPRHGKSSSVSHDGSGLFQGLPNPFEAGRYHSLVVDEKTLPPDLRVAARSDDGLVMAIAHRTRPAWGVQFHPESVLTPDGETLIANFLRLASGGRVEERMTPDVAEALRVVATRKPLPRGLAEATFGDLMDGRATEAQKGALLLGIATRGETADEIAGAVVALRRRMRRVATRRSPLLDTCGPGGLGRDLFNLSTAAAVVAAGAGAAVAKHGNRSISSRVGSADVLIASGVGIELDAAAAGRILDEVGLVFLFAPSFHPAMKELGTVRRELGIRTIFNALGPLANPAGAARQLIGVGRPELVPLLAGALASLGSERAIVFHSENGLDELVPGVSAARHRGPGRRDEALDSRRGRAPAVAGRARGASGRRCGRERGDARAPAGGRARSAPGGRSPQRRRGARGRGPRRGRGGGLRARAGRRRRRQGGRGLPAPPAGRRRRAAVMSA